MNDEHYTMITMVLAFFIAIAFGAWLLGQGMQKCEASRHPDGTPWTHEECLSAMR